MKSWRLIADEPEIWCTLPYRGALELCYYLLSTNFVLSVTARRCLWSPSGTPKYPENSLQLPQVAPCGYFWRCFAKIQRNALWDLPETRRGPSLQKRFSPCELRQWDQRKEIAWIEEQEIHSFGVALEALRGSPETLCRTASPDCWRSARGGSTLMYGWVVSKSFHFFKNFYVHSNPKMLSSEIG